MADRPPISRNQLDRIGSRVRRAAREGRAVEAEVRDAIDVFRLWHLPVVEGFRAGWERRVAEIGAEELLAITARLKTTTAIEAKLQRGHSNLSTMQDVAGARIVVLSLAAQEGAVSGLRGSLRDLVYRIDDTRDEPGPDRYRAVHVLLRLQGRRLEVQVRTLWQDSWAQLVEGVDDLLGSDLKHQDGPAEWLEWLRAVSDVYRERDLGRLAVTPSPPDVRLDPK